MKKSIKTFGFSFVVSNNWYLKHINFSCRHKTLNTANWKAICQALQLPFNRIGCHCSYNRLILCKRPKFGLPPPPPTSPVSTSDFKYHPCKPAGAWLDARPICIGLKGGGGHAFVTQIKPNHEFSKIIYIF